ncbi:HIRAN domain-containing protein [Stenotrophomonas sp.]|uniref:HIRAN domain-containing protein n=1 Tax=Stenotrophomonas sp. TaxID=69392 RepID=UPI0028A2BAA5|nr:HIRAN domain-containing protein [Stenotrophomonas sp.]
MKALYIALQDPQSHSWAPVARVWRSDGVFRLRYTQGAGRVSGFVGFARMDRLDGEFVSPELFPLLKNRVLARGRPEFGLLAQWVGREKDEIDAFDEIALTGGLRGTDSIELIPEPEPSADGRYEAEFFVHGVRYLSEASQVDFSALREGDSLCLASDLQNKFDAHALLLRTSDPVSVVGYVPRYYSEDFSSLVGELRDQVNISVVRANLDAPLAFRVLCKLDAPWPQGFESCKGTAYLPYVDSPVSVQVLS